MNNRISQNELGVLRELSRKVAEISQKPENLAKQKLWMHHNRLQRCRPLIRVAPEGSWCELVPDSTLVCTSEFGRFYERDLRQRIYRDEHLRDDTFICDMIWSSTIYENTWWGFEAKRIETGTERGAFKWDHPMKAPDDFAKMRKPKVFIDEEKSRRNLEIVLDIFGDILEVKLARTIWDLRVDTNLVDTLASFRGNEQFMLDMYERPGWVHTVMSFMTEAVIDLLKDLETNVDLELNNGPTCDGLGSMYLTDELPSKNFSGRYPKISDLWGTSDAQEFAGVSPEMHYEFGLQYQMRVLEMFGMSCYGCCEPLHNKLEYVKKIPNIRRVSVSPWADVHQCAAQLGDKYIYSWKPSPWFLAEPDFDEQKIRNEITMAVNAAKEYNCVMEMTLKDTHTVRNEPVRLEKWIQIAKLIVDTLS